ncbi:hypothetical protein R6Q57_003270 [Mikania cordata]
MDSIDFKKNPNLDHDETTKNNHHVLPSLSSSSSQDFNRNHHHQHNIHISRNTHQDQGSNFKKLVYEVIKKPSFLSCSSPAVGGEGSTPPPPPPSSPPPPPQDFKKPNHQPNSRVSNKINENEGFNIKNPNLLSCSMLASGGGDTTKPPPPEVAAVEESGRERIKRHRVEMAGRVWIPDIWGHEDLLKGWIDCSVFDSSLGNKTIMSARAALMQEGRSTLRIKNKC